MILTGVLLLIVGVFSYDLTPIVQVAYPDEVCIQVIPERAGSCASLPEKYTVEWVSPR